MLSLPQKLATSYDTVGKCMTEFEQDSNFLTGSLVNCILHKNISILEILLKPREVYYFV